MSFPCPDCGHKRTDVKDSRPSVRGIHRRRRCPICGFRFSTIEAQLGQRRLGVLTNRLLRELPSLADDLRALHQAIPTVLEDAEAAKEDKPE